MTGLKVFTRCLLLFLLVTNSWGYFPPNASAQVGITVEIGQNDFRISFMGPNGDSNYDVESIDLAYNSQDDEFLVVWQADDGVDDEKEIYGQRIKAASGALVENHFKISSMGLDGDITYQAAFPAVAYNSSLNQYLVVWEGDDDSNGLVNDEFEIFGQLLEADGTAIGTNDFQISDMGGNNGDPNYDARFPEVAYSLVNNTYLVAWRGDDTIGSLVDDELEIYGQLITSNGNATGVNDFRISDAGPDGNASYSAFGAEVVYNSQADEYLVIWKADENNGSLANDEYEIYGQRIKASNGASMGTNDFRITDIGIDGQTSESIDQLHLAYNSSGNEYLVVWTADDSTMGLADNEFEVWGQRLNASGTEIGTNDFRLSDLGPDGNANFDATYVAVTYNATANEYVVVWNGDDNINGLVNDEIEIFGQRVSATGIELGDNDFRLSDMGTTGSANFSAKDTTIRYSPSSRRYFIVWYGDDNINGLVDSENEAFGQFYAIKSELYLPFVVRNTCRTTTMEAEENDMPSQANGPLCSGLIYQGFQDDQKDYFSVVLDQPGTLNLSLTNVSMGTQLQLFYMTNTTPPVKYSLTPPHQFSYSGSAGIYYIYVATPNGFNSAYLYNLQVTYP